MIRQVCLFCRAELGTISEDDDLTEKTSNGVCLGCTPRFFDGSGTELSAFLDRFEVPVFVVDTGGRIVCGNTSAMATVGKGLSAIEGRLGGEVFECMYAKLPNGCGETIHCKSCTIRNTVMETLETGQSKIKVPAYMDLGDLINHKSVKFVISTDKVGEGVLIRIEEILPQSANA